MENGHGRCFSEGKRRKRSGWNGRGEGSMIHETRDFPHPCIPGVPFLGQVKAQVGVRRGQWRQWAALGSTELLFSQHCCFHSFSILPPVGIHPNLWGYDKEWKTWGFLFKLDPEIVLVFMLQTVRWQVKFLRKREENGVWGGAVQPSSQLLDGPWCPTL